MEPERAKPSGILIHHDLMRRLRDSVSVGAVGLYVLICQHAAREQTNGRVHMIVVRDLMGETRAERLEAFPDLRELQEAGFLDSEPPDYDELVIQDWGEWVVAMGEAGFGAE